MPKAATHIVLIGAGHAHVEVLRSFRIRPEPHVHLTLLTKSKAAPYSGMVPGYVAGHYSRSDIDIQVDRLAEFEHCKAVYGRVVRLEANSRSMMLSDGNEVVGDIISIDVGAVTDTSAAPVTSGLLVSVKPMDDFETRWPAIEQVMTSSPNVRIAVVGAGAAGVELALAIRQRLRAIAGAPPIVLLERSDQILAGYSGKARARLVRILKAQDIETRTGFSGFNKHGANEEFGVLVWAAGVSPAPWLIDSGLAVDQQGFIAVNSQLQSVSHPAIFAAGDAAGMVTTPRPKSGVMAVRQGPILAENLRRAARGVPLKSYTPQKQWLSIISAGSGYAVATRGFWSTEGRWVWKWKDWLDRRFINRFSF